MVQVHIHAGLLEGVHGSARRTGGDGPGFQVLRRGVGQIATLPDVVAVTTDQVGIREAVGLRVVDHHRLANLGRQRVLARVGTLALAEHDVRRDQLVHDLAVVGHRLGRAAVALELAFLIPGQIEVLLADVVGTVVVQFLAVLVMQAFLRQHRDGAVHAVHHVPRNHRAARSAVIHEGARLGGLPAHLHLLTRLDVGQIASTQRARGGMEVDVVHQLVLGQVLQRQLDVVTLVNDDHRARNRAVEGERPHEDARLNLDFLLFDEHLDLHHARRLRRRQAVLRNERRLDQLLLHALQLRNAGRRLDDIVTRQPAGGGDSGIGSESRSPHEAGTHCGADKRLAHDRSDHGRYLSIEKNGADWTKSDVHNNRQHLKHNKDQSIGTATPII